MLEQDTNRTDLANSALAFPDQCAGLRQQAAQTRPQWVSVVQHGDRDAEMNVLWQICTGMHSLGYSLCVLDATATESSDTPGLLDMLEHAYHPASPNSGMGWPIVPAAIGIRQWLDSKPTHGQALASMFNAFGALVVYADAQTLGELAPHQLSGAVVALSPEMTSMLSAYNSLKLLTQQGGLQSACVVTVSPYNSPLYLAHNIAQSLQKCTMNFLQCEVQHFDSRTHFDAENLSDDVRKLVIHLLDNGTPHRAVQRHVRRPVAHRAPSSRQGQTLAWSH